MVETDVVAAIVVGVIALAAVLQVTEAWLDGKFKQDMQEGELLPTPLRSFSYGDLYTWNGQLIGRYVFIRLFSYVWDKDIYTQRECWHERVLIRDPHKNEWRVRLIPERHTA